MTVLELPYFLGGHSRYCPFLSQYVLIEQTVWRRQSGRVLRGESERPGGIGNFLIGAGGTGAGDTKEEVIGGIYENKWEWSRAGKNIFLGCGSQGHQYLPGPALLLGGV